jgi:hypothetical protein
LNGWCLTEKNAYGGFKLDDCDEGVIRGHLWPTYEKAVAAAKHVLKSTPEAEFGIMKLVAVVERTEQPVKVTKLTR